MKKKRINNRLMHVLRFIWKHLSNHDAFEAHSVPVHACWRLVIVDARQKKLIQFVVGLNEGVFERPW